jgi:ATP-dependent Clp protease ATP-binding subunit ClpA
LPTGGRLAQLAAEAAGAPTPGAALRKVAELRQELDDFERSRVADALAEGASFAAIARDLGLSRQAVHRRFRNATTPRLETAPGVARVLRYAREEAAATGSADLRSEYVLLGVLRAREIPAAGLLVDVGVTLERARAQVEGTSPRTRLFRREKPDVTDLHMLLVAPVDQARRRGSRTIEVEHLLLGMLDDPAGGAYKMLRALAVDPDAIRRRLEVLLESRATSDRLARALREPDDQS